MMVHVTLVHQSMMAAALVLVVGAPTGSPINAIAQPSELLSRKREIEDDLHNQQQKWLLRKRGKGSHSRRKRRSSSTSTSSSASSSSSGSDKSKSRRSSHRGSSTSKSKSQSSRSDTKSSRTDTRTKDDTSSKSKRSSDSTEPLGGKNKTSDETDDEIMSNQHSSGVPSLSQQTSTTSPSAIDSAPESENEKDACQVNPNGAFGNQTIHLQEIQFYYQVETIASTAQNELDSILLPLLETAVADRLLPFLFVECGRDLSRMLQDFTGTSCVAEGLSSLPIDKVLSGGRIKLVLSLLMMCRFYTSLAESVYLLSSLSILL